MTTDATGTVQAAPQQPVSAFDKMLAFLETEDKGHGQVEATAEDAAETPASEAESATEESEAAGDEQAEQDPEGAESEGEEEAEAPAGDTLYTVRVDGKDEKVPLSELLAGYSRTSDYTRKTQEVATQRKELERVQGELVQERQEYAALLPKLRQMLGGEESEPNWEALRQVDPARAAVEWQRWQERKARLADLQAEEERVAQLERSRMLEAQKQFIAQEREKLLKLPELAHWSDAEKRKADGSMVAQTLLSAGFSEEELQITDHRAMLIAYKAALYDKSQAAAKKAKESIGRKVERSPVVKAGSPAGKPKGAADRALSRLAQTGSREAAAEWFLHKL